jgi:hypothetical protein
MAEAQGAVVREVDFPAFVRDLIHDQHTGASPWALESPRKPGT